MKKEVLRYCTALVLNTAPFFLGCFLYEGGIVIDMLFAALQILLNFLNYKWTDKIMPFLFLNTVMLISSLASNKIINRLYYTNVSSDNGTLAVGDFSVKFTFIFIALMTLISAVYRAIIKLQDRRKRGE